jgi:hypothetical protein
MDFLKLKELEGKKCGIFGDRTAMTSRTAESVQPVQPKKRKKEKFSGLLTFS